ncbi:flagellar hook-length control protein FliK [Tissierella sp. MSJ-40]|uniref:Flagellar hook-length control protein FliK n=1 Tax=Tissierella simiarum TaxID=2841534 RepID=A0ABS6E592_9FIRM|nr:flagellar hook-length control protein FliK [Tissierella simiarum]MBU5437706.1 flagellar hook-length control protein FliK [Tissierella simiarum]
MEVKIMDFKQSLKSEGSKNNAKLQKDKNFMDILSTTNNNIKDLNKEVNKDNNLNSSKETALNPNEGQTNKVDEEENKVEFNEKNKTAGYENIINLFNLISGSIEEVESEKLIDNEVFKLSETELVIQDDSISTISESNSIDEAMDLSLHNSVLAVNTESGKKSNTSVEEMTQFLKTDDVKTKNLLTDNILNEDVEAEIEINKENKSIELKSNTGLDDGEVFNKLESQISMTEGNSLNQEDYSNQEENAKKDVDMDMELDLSSVFNKGKLGFDNDIKLEKEETHQVERREIFQQIVDKIKISLNEEKNEIKIKLKPEILGELVLKIEMEDGVVLAKALVDNYRTKELIETNLIQLKEGMKESGLEIKTFEVFVGNNSDFDKKNSSEFNFKPKNKKIKVKNEETKKIVGYEDNSLSEPINNMGIYNESSLNILA